MKRLLLISLSVLCLGGCVYPSPYGYSRYTTTVTPVYPRTYYEHRYSVPAQPRSYRYYEHEHRGHHPHFRQHRHW